MMSSPSDAGTAAEAASRVSVLLTRASTAVIARKQTTLAALDLTVNQYGAMLWLRCNPGASHARVARALGITPQATGALLNDLVVRGLCQRAPSAAHGRLLEVSLTPAGETLLDQAEALAEQVEGAYARAFTATELDTFVSLLQRAFACQDGAGPTDA